MINVGIIGCGFVGGALKDWLEHNNPECKLFISDPAKGYHDNLSNIDIAFLQIHVPTEDDGTQDLRLMKELITNLPDVPVFVRTTILPGTNATSSLARQAIRYAICPSSSPNVHTSRISRSKLWCLQVRKTYSPRFLSARNSL
ncbi:hypothetical protein NXX53_05275 [Bacteroides salyersiae]|nr:hypothetical protein [Bacteroides salyersiae]